MNKPFGHILRRYDGLNPQQTPTQPMKTQRPPKLLARYCDLVRLGIPVRELKTAIASGAIPVITMTKGKQRRFCMRSALRLYGLHIDDGLVPATDLDVAVAKRVEARLTSMAEWINSQVDKRLIERVACSP